MEVDAPSALMLVRNFVLGERGLPRPPLEWEEETPRWPNGLRRIFSLGRMRAQDDGPSIARYLTPIAIPSSALALWT